MSVDPKVVIKELQDVYIVSLTFEKRPLFRIKKKDQLSIKIAIVSMVNSGLAKQIDLARAFHLHRDTIANYLKSYKKSGLAGLKDHRTNFHSINEEIENRVLELLCTPTKKTKISNLIYQEFGKSISRTKIYDIRKKYLNVIQKNQLQDGNEDKKK